MKIIYTEIPDVLIVEPRIFGDDRGFFYESYNERKWRELTGLDSKFVQDNHSLSLRGVVRGLHYQIQQTQGKLIRVVSGAIFDVAADIRRSSRTYGKWVAVRLSAENKRQFWIPGGFAHGFLVLSESAEVLYKATDYYAPEHERCIIWNDPELAIDWPLEGEPVLSPKDSKGLLLKDAEVFE